MNRSSVWREELFIKHSKVEEVVRICLIINALLVIPYLLIMSTALVAGFISASGYLSCIQLPFGVLAIVYLVWCYLRSHLAWYNYNQKMLRDAQGKELPFFVFSCKYFHLLIFGKTQVL